MNVREKGAAGERELAKYLGTLGVEARRGCQFSGGPDSPDIVHALPNVHIECKRVEAVRVHEAVAQAKMDARHGDTPVVFWRRNRGKWLCVIHPEDFLSLMRELQMYRKHFDPTTKPLLERANDRADAV